MITGVALLLAAAVVIYLGFGHRVLDRLRLSDRAALVILLIMLVGSFLPDIPLTKNTSINIGGGVTPLFLAFYLWSKAEKREIIRSVIALMITAVAVYALMKVMPLEPTYNIYLDPLYVIAILAGFIGYLAGRSRRGSFIAGSLAIILNDLAAQAENYFTGGRSLIVIGGAGIFDAVVIAGFLALGLSEIIGEAGEKIFWRRSPEKE